MVLNDFEKVAGECWRAIPEHFPSVELSVRAIMPNHAHGIIVINDDGMQHVGATQWVAPTCCMPKWTKTGSLGTIIGSYKMAVTRRIQREHNATGIWQRNYYEHIIRNKRELDNICVASNPILRNGMMMTRTPQSIGSKIHYDESSNLLPLSPQGGRKVRLMSKQVTHPTFCQKPNGPSPIWGTLYPSRASGKVEGGSHGA